MPVVEKMLFDVCQKTPSREMLPEAAVAQGAAIHAAILEAKVSGAESRMGEAIMKRLRAVTVSDVNSHSLGVKVTDPKSNSKINHIMIPRNHEIPYSTSQKFVTTSDNQKRIHVYVLEGEARDPDACSPIGDFVISNLPPSLPKGSPVEVTYHYDANGRIQKSAKELTGNSNAAIEIIRDSGLDKTGLDAFHVLAKDYTID